MGSKNSGEKMKRRKVRSGVDFRGVWKKHQSDARFTVSKQGAQCLL
jgi:hypothetical protein